MPKVVKLKDLPKSARPNGLPFIVTTWPHKASSDHQTELKKYALEEAAQLRADYVVIGNWSYHGACDAYYQAVQAYSDPKKKK